VAELAKRRAQGICQLCDDPAPFVDKKGNPFLETHHIVWLSKDGEDTIENTVALCPNCHRKMHSLNLKYDRNTLTTKAAEFAL
jgi:5-methylcytosine-specific restriction protein A